MLPGGGAMHLCDSLGQHTELEYICCLHEQACAFAAEAYGEFDNNLACVLVTTGPGGTNTLTGVAAAWIESSPVLFLSGQVKRADSMTRFGVRSMGPQEVDIVSMVKPITKFAARVADPSLIRSHLEEAVYRATNARKGPVWLDIPLDVQAVDIDPEALQPFVAPNRVKSSFESSIKNIIDRLLIAKRPVIYAGNGVRTSGQGEMLLRLVNRLNAPVLLTWKAADLLPQDHPTYIGRPGGTGQRAANFVQQKADWILVLGARLDLPSIAFNPGDFAPGAYTTIVDVERSELSKLEVAADCLIEGDLGEFLPELVEHLETASLPDFEDWLKDSCELKSRFPIVLDEHWKQAGSISTYVLIDVLSKLTGPDDVIVPGSSGPCSDILMQAWRVKAGQRILNAPGLGAMGTGLPGAIGACIASGRRRTINVNGDGGFQLNIQELETARRLNLPIKFFVLENGGYRSIVAMQMNHFNGRLVASEPSSGLTLPNVARVAEAYGIPSFTASEAVELEKTIQRILLSEGPALCVVKTALTEATMPRCTSEIRPDGTVVSKPMHDMWPFLDPVEIDKIMRL